MATKTAARTASAPQAKPCPEWCDGVHNADGWGNFFHRGQIVIAAVPEESAMPTLKDVAEVPLLTAHLVLPDGPEGEEEPAQITVDCGDLWGPYAELDLKTGAQFVQNLKTFTARVEQMLGQLAAIEENKS